MSPASTSHTDTSKMKNNKPRSTMSGGVAVVVFEGVAVAVFERPLRLLLLLLAMPLSSSNHTCVRGNHAVLDRFPRNPRESLVPGRQRYSDIQHGSTRRACMLIKHQRLSVYIPFDTMELIDIRNRPESRRRVRGFYSLQNVGGQSSFSAATIAVVSISVQ